ncbi:hypothetical protein AZH11_23970 [Pseudomonas simiae]|nr:hypothetical protein AZH11_23970 [Pseudomonas simiae]
MIAQGFSGLKWVRLSVEPLDSDMPGRGFCYAGYQIQQCGFACAMLPEQAYAFLAFGAKRELGNDFSFAQVLCQAAYLEHLFTE